MPYIVNETTDSLKLPGLGRVLPAGARSDRIEAPVVLTAEQAAEFAGNPNLAVFNDDGSRIDPPAVDWSQPKVIDLTWMHPQIAAEAPQGAADAPVSPITEVEVTVPAGEHVEIVPDEANGAQK